MPKKTVSVLRRLAVTGALYTSIVARTPLIAYADDISLPIVVQGTSTLIKLRALLIDDERLSTKLYRCSSGKTSIGVGRNLTDNGISRPEALYLLENDINRVISECTQAFPWFRSLDETRQIVVLSMVFNMGIYRVMGFKNMTAAIAKGDYSIAAKEMLLSRWALQVRSRAIVLSIAMRTGVLSEVKRK